MKKIIFSQLFLVILFIFSFYSCNESITHEFSHDETINEWVNNNKKTLITYNRDDIKELSIGKQKAVLRFLPPNKRKEIWEEKVDYILSLDLTKDEIKYLKWFKSALTKINYDEPFTEEFSKLLEEKLVFGQKKFDWDKEFIHKAFFNVSDININKWNSRKDKENVQYMLDGEPDTCTCTSSMWGCSGYNNTCSKPDKCKYSNYDCGILGNSECTGYCTGDIIFN